MDTKYTRFFNEQFDLIMSLGTNCYPKFFIDSVILGKKRETELFDYIGSGMWSINDLIENDFNNMTHPEEFKMVQYFSNSDPIVTNTRYYLSFMHDLHDIKGVTNADFISKVERRAKRWKTKVSSAKRPLFIRSQSISTVKAPQHPIPRIERDELDLFIRLLKKHYGVENPVVIYINLDEDGWNPEKTILSVKIDSFDFPWESSNKVFKKLFDDKDVIGSLGNSTPTSS